MLLGPALEAVGGSIGRRPLPFFAVSLLITALSLLTLYFLPFDIVLKFDDGYNRVDAPSIGELQSQINFFDSKVKPWYSALFAVPRNGSASITDNAEFNEVYKFYDKLMKLPIRGEGNQTIAYKDICGSMCDFNDILLYSSIFPPFTWPEDTIMFWYKANIGKHFFDLKLNERKDIVQANITALYFMVFPNDTQAVTDVSEFERVAQIAIDQHNANVTAKTTFTLHGPRGMELEIKRGTESFAVHFAIGLNVFCALQLIFFYFVNMAFKPISYLTNFVLWVAALLVPLCSLATSAAVHVLLGNHFNTLFLLSPIFAMILTCDGLFLIYFNWVRIGQTNKEHQTSLVLRSCGPSIFVVLSTALGFIVGSQMTVPEYANLSFFIGISLISIFFHTICLFVPTLVWIHSSNEHKPVDTGVKPTQTTCCCTKFLKKWSKLLSYSMVVKITAITSLVLFLGSSALVLPDTHGDLDYRQLLPEGSPNRMGVHFMSDKVWPQFLHILFIVERPPDFTNENDYARFKSMIRQLENLPGTIGREADMTWIKDFMRHNEIEEDAATLPMQNFRSFIDHAVYKAWRSGVRYEIDESGNLTLNKMIYMVAFNGTTTLAEKAQLIESCREVVRKYPEFRVYPFDTEVGMADSILHLMATVRQIPFLTLFSVSAFSLIALMNFVVAIVNAGLIFVIYAGTLAVMTFFGYTLNPFSVGYLMFAIAIAPKFTTHISYFLLQELRVPDHTKREQRVYTAFTKTLAPFMASWTCGFIFLLPTIFVKVQIFRELAAFHLTLHVIGLYVALLVLPSIICCLPKGLISTEFFYSRKK
ncbi:unnamed protein product [Caenorhabditis auriculariae]|uniref:SSD domain-containing protein n=1 Tax=Caenorhabditis auriculariae TaxID=2777116 RepID=A0A8S1GXU4_9PELO|nr:unnamed protein product [Caenorhabditis auriculariae]